MIVPGTIVVIDDDEVNANTDLVSPLQKMGERVLYYDEIPEECNQIVNPRLVICDWDLSNAGSFELDTNAGLIVQNIRKIKNISSFFLIVIWSIFADLEENRRQMKERIIDMYNVSYSPDFLAPEDITIVQSKMKAEQLVPVIEEWIEENYSAGLVFEWERSLESARDSWASKIANSNIKSIVKMLDEQLNVEGIERYLTSMFSKLLLREIITEGTNFSRCIDGLLAQGEDGLDLTWYSNFHNLQSYYYVKESEQVMTGDLMLLDPDNTNGVDKYGVVLNCYCDFMQKKVNYIKILKGAQFSTVTEYDRTKVSAEDTIPFEFGWYIKKAEKQYHKRTDLVEKIANNNLQQRYYRLLFMKDNVTESDYYHLIFDFNRVESVKIELDEYYNPILPKKWKRFCRIDSPIIEDLLQRYSSYSARIGVPEIPTYYLKEEIKRLKS